MPSVESKKRDRDDRSGLALISTIFRFVLVSGSSCALSRVRYFAAAFLAVVQLSSESSRTLWMMTQQRPGRKVNSASASGCSLASRTPRMRCWLRSQTISR